jgi:hypothetical protein
MKRTFQSALLLMILSFCTKNSFAQTFQDYFKPETKVTWLGIDFTDVKVIGHTDIDLEDLAARQFQGINELVLAEPKKFELDKAFHKENVESDLSLVKAKNKSVTDSQIKSDNDADLARFSSATIDKMVKGYDFGSKKGIGVIFFMEGMSKKKERSYIWVTFIDMPSKKVLYTERMEEKVGGFGLRNYYAHSIYEALEDIEKKFKDWKKANGG